MLGRKRIKILARLVAVMVITLFAILNYNYVHIAGNSNKDNQNGNKDIYASSDSELLPEETSQNENTNPNTLPNGEGSSQGFPYTELDHIDSAHTESVDSDPVKEEIPDQAFTTQNMDDSKKEESNYKNVFSHSLFIGDSITEGLSFYQFVNKSNVYSKLGLTLQNADGVFKYYDKNPPQVIFLMFGANDLEINGNDTFFLENYTNLIQSLKMKWPDAHVYIQSILPMAPHAEQKYNYLNNQRIVKANSALKTLAASEEKITYIDVRSVLVGVKKDLYERDGIHFKKEFYTMWLDYLTEVLNNNDVN